MIYVNNLVTFFKKVELKLNIISKIKCNNIIILENIRLKFTVYMFKIIYFINRCRTKYEQKFLVMWFSIRKKKL